MAEHGDMRDRLAALERMFRELQKTVGRLGALANLGELRLIAAGVVVEDISPGSMTLDGDDVTAVSGEGRVLIVNAAIDTQSHVVAVKSYFNATVTAGAACVIGQANGIWILISADC